MITTPNTLPSPNPIILIAGSRFPRTARCVLTPASNTGNSTLSLAPGASHGLTCGWPISGTQGPSKERPFFTLGTCAASSTPWLAPRLLAAACRDTTPCLVAVPLKPSFEIQTFDLQARGEYFPGPFQGLPKSAPERADWARVKASTKPPCWQNIRGDRQDRSRFVTFFSVVFAVPARRAHSKSLQIKAAIRKTERATKGKLIPCPAPWLSPPLFGRMLSVSLSPGRKPSAAQEGTSRLRLNSVEAPCAVRRLWVHPILDRPCQGYRCIRAPLDRLRQAICH